MIRGKVPKETNVHQVGIELNVEEPVREVKPRG